MGVNSLLLLPFTIFHVLLSLKWDNNAPLGNVPSVPTEMRNLCLTLSWLVLMPIWKPNLRTAFRVAIATCRPSTSPYLSSCCGWANIKVEWGTWTLAEPQSQWNPCAPQLSGSIMLPVSCRRTQVGGRLQTLWQHPFGLLDLWLTRIRAVLAIIRFGFPGQWVNYCFMICFWGRWGVLLLLLLLWTHILCGCRLRINIAHTPPSSSSGRYAKR